MQNNTLGITGAKAGSKKPRTPKISKDTVASVSTVRILYGLSEGEIEGLADGAKSIRLDGTPLVDDAGKPNFDGVTWDFREGTNDQEYIKGFPDVSNETGVGVELRDSNPWVKAFSNTQLSAVRVRLKWNNLSQTNAENGDVTGYRIDYAIDLQTDGGSYTEVLKAKIHDKTSAGYERTHRIDLPRATTGWQIRVRRITPNSDSDLIQDKMYVDAVAEVIDVKLRYPNTALLAVEYDAETFQSIAKIAVRVKGKKIKVPKNYDPATRRYTGLWDGTFKLAYSNNPAWIYYDILTHWRYGLGDRIDPSMVDKWTLYALGQYCDEIVDDGQGGGEPRFTCNVYLQTQADAYQVLRDIGGIFRALSFWNGEKVILDADLPQDPTYTFSRANVIDGVFNYSGTRQRDRHTIARVAWSDPNNDFATTYEFVRDEKAMAKFGVKVLELNAFGCTSQGQAIRAGRWALRSEQLETRLVSFAVGLDGYIPQGGKVINISDEIFAGRANGGRVTAISGNVVTLDREITEGDELLINGADGKTERRIITAINGRDVTVDVAFNHAEPENVYAIESADLQLMKFRVMSIVQNDDLTFNISAIQYEPQKYDAIDFGYAIEPPQISVVDIDQVSAPETVDITSRYRLDQAQTVTTLIINWAQVKTASYYDVEWRKDGGTWQKLPRTSNVSAEVDGVYSGNYQARVRGISAFDIAGPAKTSQEVAIEGKAGAPEPLALIRAKGILFGFELSWGFKASHGDVAFTEIQIGDTPETNVVTLGVFAYPTDSHNITGLQGNITRHFRARVVDKLGFKSPWTAWSSATTSNDPDAVLDLLTGNIDESLLGQEFKKKIDKIGPMEDLLGDDTKGIKYELNEARRKLGEETDRINAIVQDRTQEAEEYSNKFQELAREDGRLAGEIDNRVTVEEYETGVLATKIDGVFAQVNPDMAGDTEKWAGDNTVFAGVWTERTARIEGDMAQAKRVDGVAAELNENKALITEVSEATTKANEVTASKVTALSGQLVGGYEGAELAGVKSGLLYDEMVLRLQEDEALAERISLLSVGVGEAFDPFIIWHFDKDAEGWTGGTFNSGYYNARTTDLQSPPLVINTVDDDGNPATEAIETARYHHIKGRIIKVGSPTWDGSVTWTGGTASIAEPTFAGEPGQDQVGIINLNLNWTGAVSFFNIKLAATADNLNYYKIDWIAVGTPSPAASSAQLARVDKVHATKYSALSQTTQELTAKVDGKPGEQSLAQMRSTLTTAASRAESSANQFTELSTKYSGNLASFYGDVFTGSTSIASKLGVLTEDFNGVFAQVNPKMAGDTDIMAGDDRPDQLVGAWSQRSAVIEGDLRLAHRVDGVQVENDQNKAAILEERKARIDADEALTAIITQAEANYADNTASYKNEVTTYANNVAAYAGQVTQFNATVNGIDQKMTVTQGAVDKMGNQFTVKIDAGNRITGFGLAKNAPGSAQYDFAVRSDKFYIAAPKQYESLNIPDRPMFSVVTTKQTVDGVDIVPGVYIDTAAIKNASITAAHIDKASVTSLSAISANIGHFKSAESGARLEIKDSVLEVYDENNQVRVRLGLW